MLILPVCFARPLSIQRRSEANIWVGHRPGNASPLPRHLHGLSKKPVALARPVLAQVEELEALEVLKPLGNVGERHINLVGIRV